MAKSPVLKALGSARTRTMVIFLGLLFVLAALFAYSQFSSPPNPLGEQTSSSLGVPPNITATPGEVSNERYRDLLIEANKQRVDTAKKDDGSALPNIIVFNSDGSCQHGRYNELGQCDPNGRYDKNGNLIYDAAGGLLCPSQRYNEQGQCDPKGLYDVDKKLTFDDQGNQLCSFQRYDAQGRCDPYGLYDKNGKLIDPDCVINRYDAQGKCDPNGQYDKNGKLLACPSDRYNEKGECDPNGKYDRNGNLIGGTDASCPSGRYNENKQCDPNGKYDRNGNLIGGTDASCPSGRYNENKQCDPNGLYDKDGRRLDCPAGRYNEKGQCDPNGQFDANGNALCPPNTHFDKGQCQPTPGSATTAGATDCPGERYNIKGECDPNGLYDKNGKPICPSGRYNAQRECDPKGLFDANGNVLCPSARYNAEGKCDPNGQFDANGNPLCPSGKYNVTGECDPEGDFDASGNLIPSGGKKSGSEDEAKRQLDEQRSRIDQARKEREAQQDAERARAEAERARQAFAQSVDSTEKAMEAQAKAAMMAWSTVPVQTYAQGVWAAKDKNLNAGLYDPKLAANQGETTATANTSGSTLATAPVSPVAGNTSNKTKKEIIKAGTILYGVLDTGINTDEPSPVMATVVFGPYKGAKLMGTVQAGANAEKAVVKFSRISFPNRAASAEANVVAIDPDTARSALASNVDKHLLLRYGSLFASSFMEGYGKAIKDSGSVTTQSGTGTVTTQNKTLNGKESFTAALGNVGDKWSQQAAPLFKTPYTITVDAGMSLALLFLDDLALVEE